MGMIPCEVESHYGAYIVRFDDGKDFLLQSDYDQAAFAFVCGLIPEDKPALLADVDLEDVSECPDDYYDIAE